MQDKSTESHQLDDRTVRKLQMIGFALYSDRMEPDPEQPGSLVQYPVVRYSVQTRYLGSDLLEILETHGIPARSDTPFRLSYVDVRSPGLPPQANAELFFNSLIDLLYCYWSVLKGFQFFREGGFDSAARLTAVAVEFTSTSIMREQGLGVEEALSRVDAGLNPRVMLGKWYADATLVKLRSTWDKALSLIGNHYFETNVTGRSWESRVGKLSTFHGQLANGLQRDMLGVFLSLCQEIGELRQYRDSDVHQISPRVPGGLGRIDRGRDLVGVWDLMQVELGRVTEALLACFGCVVTRTLIT